MKINSLQRNTDDKKNINKLKEIKYKYLKKENIYQIKNHGIFHI